MAIIEARNLTKKFHDIVAVNDISFSVKEGGIFAFLGPNGAGKTTTIKILTTLLLPTNGHVLVNGHDTVKEQNEVRKSLGIVFQDQSLDEDLTAEENMEFHGVIYGVPKNKRNERIKKLLEFVDLTDRKKDLVKHFSGGMKRRLEIARGLIHHPKILFLDEPTIGLDPQTRNHIWSFIANLNKTEGMTVFLTTHYIEEAEKMANEVAIIDKGTIISQGSPNELKTANRVNSLEEVFLKFTGRQIRTETVSSTDRMRMHRRVHR